jgi:hypothetical protein
MAKARREWRAGNDRRIAPMVRHDEHRQSFANVGAKKVNQTVHLAFKTWRNVMN